MSAAVAALVRERIGLDPASLGPATLPRAVAGRMHERGIGSPESYRGLLVADPGEWAALLADLLVPETWFFRGGRAYFAGLAGWLRGRAAAGPVRVLCVPCSTGEEPYSLAMALAEAGVPPARCRIDALDLSADHIARAGVARYTAFSFREPVGDPRAKFFREVEPGRWELAAGVRDAVRFRPGNVIDADFLAGESLYDLILCRNLFIYLTDAARERAVANLDRLLAADGRLGLTPAEADRLPATRFVADGPAALAIFRRALPGTAAVPAAPGRMKLATVRQQSPVPAVPAPVQKAAGTDAVPGADPTAAVRQLADAGRLAEARAACERAVAAAPSASLFSLLGALDLAGDSPDAAAEAFRRALYLDPDHREALTHMIVLCERRGEAAQAAGLRRRLARLDGGAGA